MFARSKANVGKLFPNYPKENNFQPTNPLNSLKLDERKQKFVKALEKLGREMDFERNEPRSMTRSQAIQQLQTHLLSWPTAATRFFLNNCKHSKPKDPNETDCPLIVALNYARLISDVVAQDEAHSSCLLYTSPSPRD